MTIEYLKERLDLYARRFRGLEESEVATKAKAYIEILENERPRWFSVGEKLPEDDAIVEVTNDTLQIKVIAIVRNDDGSRQMRLMIRYKDINTGGNKRRPQWKWKNVAGMVTHWQYLPEPPARDEVLE